MHYSLRLPRAVARALAVAALLAGVSTWSMLGPAGAAAAGTPAGNPAQQGYVALCDQAGNNVSGGSLATTPFVWKAVSSTRPPAQYEGSGQNAVLSIFQERPGVPPAEWSGNSLTAATLFANRRYPTAQATYADGSLASFVKAFPPRGNGLYQLRMYYGKAGYGLYDATYPATTIQVRDGRWRVVAGGTINCSAAKGTSNEQLTSSIGRTQFTPRRPDLKVETLVSAGGSPHAYRQAAAVIGSLHSSPVTQSSSTSGGGTGWLWPASAAAIVLGAGAVWFTTRGSTRGLRRRPAGSAS